MACSASRTLTPSSESVTRPLRWWWRVFLVHPGEQVFIHADGEVGAGCQNVEVPVRHHGCDFNDGFSLDVKAGHLKIDPNHAVVAVVHDHLPLSEGLDSSFTAQRGQDPFLEDSKVSMICPLGPNATTGV